MTLRERRNALMISVAALAQQYTAPLLELTPAQTAEALTVIGMRLETLSVEALALAVDYQDAQ